ncbi:MAG: hypothetical protein M0R22_00535 [Dehalococcoidia bacterium]|jgi:hypothetical protein|nr:hypothetical protein [Dehalococcoidia bacterium]
MGRQFTYNSRDYWIFRASEADEVVADVGRAAAGLQAPAGEGCAEFTGQLEALAAQYVSALNAASTNYDPSDADVFSVPYWAASESGEGLGTDEVLALWDADATLRSMRSYAPMGLVVPLEWRQPLEQIVAGVLAVESGRCAIRTRWGLVGTVAVLGAAVLAGGAYIYDRAKKPRRRR